MRVLVFFHWLLKFEKLDFFQHAVSAWEGQQLKKEFLREGILTVANDCFSPPGLKGGGAFFNRFRPLPSRRLQGF